MGSTTSTRTATPATCTGTPGTRAWRGGRFRRRLLERGPVPRLLSHARASVRSSLLPPVFGLWCARPCGGAVQTKYRLAPDVKSGLVRVQSTNLVHLHIAHVACTGRVTELEG